jgi:energy-coupling factor transporter ATP-binding protein EcfA2
MSRSRKIILIIGATETGKSTAAEEMALVRNERYKEPIIILSPNRQVKWLKYGEINLDDFSRMVKGIYRIHTGAFNNFFSIAFKNFKHGVIICEDATAFLTTQRDDEIFAIITGLRHPDHDCDIIFVTHAAYRTPAYIFEQADELILFKTGETWDNIKQRIPDSKKEEVKAAFMEVNADPSQWAKKKILLKTKSIV